MEKKECFCNACGRKLCLGMSPREDAFVGYKEWGYFSDKDLRIDEFLLCETCYYRTIENFLIPIKKSEKIEVLQERK